MHTASGLSETIDLNELSSHCENALAVPPPAQPKFLSSLSAKTERAA